MTIEIQLSNQRQLLFDAKRQLENTATHCAQPQTFSDYVPLFTNEQHTENARPVDAMDIVDETAVAFRAIDCALQRRDLDSYRISGILDFPHDRFSQLNSQVYLIPVVQGGHVSESRFELFSEDAFDGDDERLVAFQVDFNCRYTKNSNPTVSLFVSFQEQQSMCRQSILIRSWSALPAEFSVLPDKRPYIKLFLAMPKLATLDKVLFCMNKENESRMLYCLDEDENAILIQAASRTDVLKSIVMLKQALPQIRFK
jgi:hypothetical protein